MTQRNWTILAILSLWLTLAAGILWVGSHRRSWTPVRVFGSSESAWFLAVRPGQIVLAHQFVVVKPPINANIDVAICEQIKVQIPGAPGGAFLSYQTSGPIPGIAGFGFQRNVQPRISIYDAGMKPQQFQFELNHRAIPLWFITMLLALISCLLVSPAIRRTRREVQGRCRVCGYDLRATPNRCPECGTVPPKVATT